MLHSLLALLATLGLIAIHHFIIRPVVYSPLAKIPCAHWSVAISPFWILRARKNGRENGLLLEAHRRLGPVVRVGPDTVSINGADAVKTVYQGGFEKDPWYSVFDNYGVPCMFSARGSPEHSARKRMIANVYSKSYLQTSFAAKAQAKTILFERLVPLLKESSSPHLIPHGIDVHSIFLATTMDFISAYVYGLQSGTNFIQDKGYRDHWLELYNARNDYHFWSQELPRLTAFFQKLGLWLYPAWVDDANAELSRWNMGLCEKALNSASDPQRNPNPAGQAVVLEALNSGIDKEAIQKGRDSLLYSTVVQKRDLSVASELFDHVLAGQETAGVTLTYTCWHLSKRPLLQEQLRKELLTLQPNMRSIANEPGDLPDPRQLDALPLLQAIIMETLRLHAPIPGPQPRRTPYPSCMIGDYQLPGGIRIAGLAHTLHREEQVFNEPLTWDHTRWLTSCSTEEELRERHRSFWAFSSGGRMCIGSNFAMNEMKLIVAAIYTNFTTHNIDDSGIEQIGGYTARPASDRLIVRFEPVKPRHVVGVYKRLNIPQLSL